MKPSHLAAISCFAIALANYSLGSKTDFIAGFAVLGIFFETIGWKAFFNK